MRRIVLVALAAAATVFTLVGGCQGLRKETGRDRAPCEVKYRFM